MSAPSSGRFGIVPARLLEDKQLGDAAKTVYGVLATHANAEGLCWPKQEMLAERLGKTRTAVTNQIKVLEDYGYIRNEPLRRANGRKGANRYFLVYHKECLSRGSAGSKAAPRSDEPPTPEVTLTTPDVTPSSPKVTSYIRKNEPIERNQKTCIDARHLKSFRDAYPVTPHGTDKAVSDALNKAIANGADLEVILHAAKEYRAYCQDTDWYNPYGPVRWLNDERWTATDPPAEQLAPTPKPAAQPKLTKEQAAWWGGLRERARKAWGEAAFRSWFARLVYDGTVVWVPDSFMRDWLMTENNVPAALWDDIKGLRLKVGKPPANEAGK